LTSSGARRIGGDARGVDSAYNGESGGNFGSGRASIVRGCGSGPPLCLKQKPSRAQASTPPRACQVGSTRCAPSPSIPVPLRGHHVRALHASAPPHHAPPDPDPMMAWEAAVDGAAEGEVLALALHPGGAGPAGRGGPGEPLMTREGMVCIQAIALCCAREPCVRAVDVSFLAGRDSGDEERRLCVWHARVPCRSNSCRSNYCKPSWPKLLNTSNTLQHSTVLQLGAEVRLRAVWPVTALREHKGNYTQVSAPGVVSSSSGSEALRILGPLTRKSYCVVQAVPEQPCSISGTA
jgi:hypothetical protein